MRYTHIDLKERRRIENGLASKKSMQKIAKMCGRSVSTISEEINNNGGRDAYTAVKANRNAKRRRKHSKLQCLKVAMSPPLKKYVIDHIPKWSPELIAGRLKNEQKDIPYASGKAIYKFVHSVHGRKIEKHLFQIKHKRKPGRDRKPKVHLDGRTMIAERPKTVDTRLEFGHYEGDFIEPGRDGSGSMLVLVERMTRYPFAAILASKTCVGVNALASTLIEQYEPESLTLDNDLAFAKHVDLSAALGAPVYFCNPYHSWEKGTIENRNGIIRLDIPKGTDLSKVSSEQLDDILDRMRNKPMKVLNYKTPQEVWNIEMEKRRVAKKEKEATLAESTVVILSESVRVEG
jgi:IS30 family transposase